MYYLCLYKYVINIYVLFMYLCLSKYKYVKNKNVISMYYLCLYNYDVNSESYRNVLFMSLF